MERKISVINGDGIGPEIMEATLKVLEAAGLRPGVINFVPGHPVEVTEAALSSPDFAGIHYTGSTPVFQGFYRTIGERIANYKTYPRIVGETGGKDFIIAHPSADPAAVVTAIVGIRRMLLTFSGRADHAGTLGNTGHANRTTIDFDPARSALWHRIGCHDTGRGIAPAGFREAPQRRWQCRHNVINRQPLTNHAGGKR